MNRKLKIILILVFGLVLSFVLVWSHNKQLKMETIGAEQIILKTDDGIKLVADYYDSPGSGAVILLHQNGQDRTSWDDLPELLYRAGFTVINLDLRGHGESDLRLSGFTPQDYRRMTRDVASALEFLREKGKVAISLIGASIGANLSLITLADQPVAIAKVVALSPGFQFKGLDAEEAVVKLKDDFLADKPRILLIAAADDAYSFETVKKFFSQLGARAEMVEYPHGGHGASILKEYPDLKQRIVEFLNS